MTIPRNKVVSLDDGLTEDSAVLKRFLVCAPFLTEMCLSLTRNLLMGEINSLR